jgi:hypothetical protein
VWPDLVVILSPCVDDFYSVCQRFKPVFIEALVSELSVKRFDEGILGRLAWLY